MISKKIKVGYDFDVRNIDRFLKRLIPYYNYPLYIKDKNKGNINAHSLLGLMMLTIKKDDVIEVAIDAPECVVEKIIDIFVKL